MHCNPQSTQVKRHKPNPTKELIFAKKFHNTPAKTNARQAKLIIPIKYKVKAITSEKHESISFTKNNFSGDIAMQVECFFINLSP